jgi:hypothetical protein
MQFLCFQIRAGDAGQIRQRLVGCCSGCGRASSARCNAGALRRVDARRGRRLEDMHPRRVVVPVHVNRLDRKVDPLRLPRKSQLSVKRDFGRAPPPTRRSPARLSAAQKAPARPRVHGGGMRGGTWRRRRRRRRKMSKMTMTGFIVILNKTVVTHFSSTKWM